MVDTYKDFEFPRELCLNPQPLIGFIGLDYLHSFVHKSIWETFTTNRQPERVSVNLISLTSDFTLLPAKPKRSSYEWHVPKGIIKTNWINKYLSLIPSIIVLFYDLDWDDTQWLEKKMECANRVQMIKSLIEGRNIKICLVLIQKSAPFNVVDDNLSTEKASELCACCDINPKLLLLLHHNEHLLGYIVRLENAFYELSQSYYSQKIRNIKSHKDHLNKTTHQYLFVRHQFKIAFFNEIKQELNVAHKQYGQTYSNLLEVRTTDANINEVKIISSYINYKLCKLNFILNQPRDAINQFTGHIDRYKVKYGPPEFVSEHYTWLSKQYSVFGDLFEEATRQGLPAVQTRHPGFYYEQAAQCAIQRKNLINDFSEIAVYPDSDPLVGWDTVEFYGQRPWRFNSRTEPYDLLKEQVAAQALQYREKFLVKHSDIIIGYLGSAIGQFKMYRSPRKRRHLVVQMADEYYCSKDNGKALTLFMRMLWEYRNDRWWSITTDLLKKSLMCAYLTASLKEYTELCVEAMILFPDDEKLRIYNNIKALVKKACPEPEPMAPKEQLEMAVNLWTTFIQTTTVKHLIVDMNLIIPFIRCKAKFMEAHSDSVKLEIYLRNEFIVPVTFSQLSVGITSATRNVDHIIEGNDLNFNPNEVRVITHEFVPSASDIGNEIQLSYVSLTFGNEQDEDRLISLRFSGKSNKVDIDRESLNISWTITKDKLFFDQLDPKLSIDVKTKSSKVYLDVIHSPPNLVFEWYPITVKLRNDEQSVMNNCVFHVSQVSDGVKGLIEICENVDSEPCHLPFQFDIGDIEIGGIVEKTLLLKTRSVDTRNICFKVIYLISNVAGEKIRCAKELLEKLECSNVFEVTASFLSLKCQHISKIYTDETALMRMQIDCISPWPIFIEDTAFKLHDDISWCSEKYVPQLKNSTLKFGEIGSDVVPFEAKKASLGVPLPLGTFTVYWKRLEHNAMPTVCTEVQLPQIQIEQLPIYIDVDIPSPGWVRTPLTLRLKLVNNSSQLLTFDILVEHHGTDVFMFSGCKQMSFSVLPGKSFPINYNLFPLKSGMLPLPYIKLSTNSDIISQNDFAELLKRTIPTSLFVMPKKKNDSVQMMSCIG